jgi:hypothetical protein
VLTNAAVGRRHEEDFSVPLRQAVNILPWKPGRGVTRLLFENVVIVTCFDQPITDYYVIHLLSPPPYRPRRSEFLEVSSPLTPMHQYSDFDAVIVHERSLMRSKMLSHMTE